MISLNKRQEAIISYIIMALILYFVFLLRLSTFHIRTWDESIYAVNAYEMIQNGQYLVAYNNGSVDYTHAKPLLAVWCQVLSIKMLGYNELAIRLPSAFAGIISCLLVFFFVKRYFNELEAWCSFMVLTTSLGFVHFHTARTGDTDSILTIFSLLSNIFLFKYLVDEKKKDRNIFLYLFFLGLAFLTKSFAALLFIPAHLFIILWQKQLINLFKRKGLYLGILAFLFFSLGYVVARQKVDPGYIQNIMSNDFSRMTKTIENHNEPFDLYFTNFMNYRFSIWILFFVMGAILLIKNHKENQTMSLFAAWTLSLITVFLFIISYSSTKLDWYDMPLYPYMGMVAGYAVFILADQFSSSIKSKRAFLGILFFIPLYFSIQQSYENRMSNGEKEGERISEYLFNKEIEGFDFNNWSVADTMFNGPMLFNKYKFQEKKQSFSLIRPQDIKGSTRVIVGDEAIKRRIKSMYNYVVIDTFYQVVAFDIRNLK